MCFEEASETKAVYVRLCVSLYTVHFYIHIQLNSYVIQGHVVVDGRVEESKDRQYTRSTPQTTTTTHHNGVGSLSMSCSRGGKDVSRRRPRRYGVLALLLISVAELGESALTR